MAQNFTGELLRAYGIDTARLSPDFHKTQIRSLEPDSLLVARGSTCQGLYFVVEGLLLAQIENVQEQNAKVPIFALTEGSWAGVADVLAGRGSSFSYFSATDLTVLEFPEGLVQTWRANHAQFNQLMTKICIEESDRSTQTLVPIKIGGAVYRVVSALASLADSFEHGHNWRSQMLASTANNHHAGATVAVPQYTLAALCGVSRSVLSPILQPLKQRGWLKLEYGATHICRPAIWARLAGKLRGKTMIDSAVPIDWAISELEMLGQS